MKITELGCGMPQQNMRRRLEYLNASFEVAIKIETGEQMSLWYKFVKTAHLNNNTSYLANLGCEPSRVFHGHILNIVLDLKMGLLHKKHLVEFEKLPMKSLRKQKRCSKMSEIMPCSPTLKRTHTMTKKQTLQN